MNLRTISPERRETLCFYLAMLCSFCTDLHLVVGMNVYSRILPVTSGVQIAATAAFLALAFRRPLSGTAKWHLVYGIGLICWVMVTKHFHALFGEPKEYVGFLLSRYLVLLPYAALCRDEERCAGLKGAGILTLLVCGWMCLWSLLLLLDLVPAGMQPYVNWSGARMNTLWNPIIFAVILFMGLALSIAGCFLAKKRWQKAALLLFALVQFLFISLTHSRTVLLMICAFAVGVFFLTLGQGSVKKRMFWGLMGVLAAIALLFASDALYEANNQRLIRQMESQGVEFRLNDQGVITDGVTNQGSLKEDAGSLNGRTETWKKILTAFRQSRELQLFGTSQFRKNIRKDISHAHNSWLDMLVSLGIPGLVLSLVLTAEILIALARAFLFCRNKARLVVALWVLCMLPIGFMEPFLFHTNHLGDLFILASGYLWSWGRKS